MALKDSIQRYDNSLEKTKQVYSGILGLAIGGSRKVNIETRAGYVYVRLRDNLSEVIQAYNDKVSPVYDFPVLIERRGNKWYITGRDDARYETFGTPAPFLPQHGDQHSFNRDGGGGGDAVFIYPDQFVPLLVYPSGTFGAGNLMVAPYVLQRDTDFIYVGNTGTGNLLVYKPSDAQAIVGLVYLDRDTGNPGVLIASGTPMNGASTGTASILPYLPYPSPSQEPLYAFRLVSGTTSLNWNNLYNVRQFYGGSTSTGTSGGGITGVVVQDEGVVQGTGTVFNFVGDNVSVTVSGTVARVFVTGSSGGSLPSFITGSIPFSGADGILTENNLLLRWDETYRGLRIGPQSPRFNFADVFPLGIVAKNPNESITFGMQVYGTGSSGGPSTNYVGYRSRGTYDAPLPIRVGDIFMSFGGRGYDGGSYAANAKINFFAAGDSVTGTYAPTGIDLQVAPSGSITPRSQLTVYGDSVNQPTGSTYNIGGGPHTHTASEVTSLKNFLNNGDGALFQRYTTPSTLTAWADGAYFADRFYLLTNGGATDIQAAQVSSGFANSKNGIRLKQVNASAKYMGFAQVKTNLETIPLRDKQVTFQFQGLSSSTPNLKCAILEWTGTADAPTKDVVNNWTSTTYTAGNFFLASNLTVAAVAAGVAASGTEGKFSVTATISSAANNIYIFWWTESAVAQNVTVDISQLDLFIGGANRSWAGVQSGDEYDCLKFCERIVGTTGFNFAMGIADSTSIAIVTLLYKVRKWTAPVSGGIAYGSAVSDFTIRYTGGAVSTATAVGTGAINKDGHVLVITGTGTPLTAGHSVNGRYANADAYILIEAELGA